MKITSDLTSTCGKDAACLLTRVLAACEKDGVFVEAIKGGSRRGPLPGLRVQLVKDLVENYGLALAKTARQSGVTTSAISRIFERNK